MQTTPGYMQTSPTFPIVRKGPISMGGKGDGGMYQGYGLTPSTDHMASLAKLSGEEKTALAGVLGVTLVAGMVWTLAVGPWAVKQFKPDWSYGKRLVTSFIAAAILRIGRGLVAPKEA